MYRIAIVFTLLTWTLARAQHALVETTPPHLSICLYNLVRVPQNILREGKRLTSDIFARSGIVVDWKDVPLPMDKTPQPACDGPALTVSRSQPGTAMGPLVEGATVEGKAWIFYDHVESYIQSMAKDVPLHEPADLVKGRVLGAIMTHEIGHILKLPHSPDGIMRARWTIRDFSSDAERHLTFSEEQTQRVIALLAAQKNPPKPSAAEFTPNLDR